MVEPVFDRHGDRGTHTECVVNLASMFQLVQTSRVPTGLWFVLRRGHGILLCYSQWIEIAFGPFGNACVCNTISFDILDLC